MPQVQSQIAVLGVTGYAGAELARLLLRHPRLAGAPPLFLGREGSARESLTAIHPQLAGLIPEQLCVEPFSWELLASHGVKMLFLATPHEQSREWVPEALARGIARDRSERRMAAGTIPKIAPSTNLKTRADAAARRRRHESVYGMPELHREESKKRAGGECRLLCHLHHSGAGAARPQDWSISIAASSAIPSPASPVQARSPRRKRISCKWRRTFRPTESSVIVTPARFWNSWTVHGRNHFHAASAADSAGNFVDDLCPLRRRRTGRCDRSLHAKVLCRSARWCGSSPSRTTAADSVFAAHQLLRCRFCARAGWPTMVIVSCLDNLLKGAAGQAVQNMNVMCGWHEDGRPEMRICGQIRRSCARRSETAHGCAQAVAETGARRTPGRGGPRRRRALTRTLKRNGQAERVYCRPARHRRRDPRYRADGACRAHQQRRLSRRWARRPVRRGAFRRRRAGFPRSQKAHRAGSRLCRRDRRLRSALA